MSDTSSPLDVADLRARVQVVVDEVLAHEATVLAGVSDDLIPMVDALTALLQAEGETVTRMGRILEGQGVIYKGKLL